MSTSKWKFLTKCATIGAASIGARTVEEILEVYIGRMKKRTLKKGLKAILASASAG